MIAVLKQEEQVNIDQRNWCKETTFTRETEKSRHKCEIQGELQGSVNLVQVKAAVHRPDDAPDATFSATGKPSGESKEMVSILPMIREYIEDEVKNGSKDEDTAQSAFQKQRDAANNLTTSLEEKKANLNDAKSDTEEKIHNAEDLQSDIEGLKGATSSMEPPIGRESVIDCMNPTSTK